MSNVYAYWQQEIAARDGGFLPSRDEPGAVSRDTDEPIDGFWRICGARTKHDTPVAIWRADGQDHIVFQWGASRPQTMHEDDDRMLKFRTTWFNSCSAVRKAEWDQALATGYWPDGKPAREISEAEKLDLIPTTAAEAGGNMPEGTDQFFEQLRDKIEALLEKANVIGKIDTLDMANEAAEIVEPLRALGKKGEAQRKIEKSPWDEGAKAVQTKWLPILEPASVAVQRLVDAIDRFRKVEEARLLREQQAREAGERARIRREEEERLRREAAERPEPMPSEEEIAVAAAQIAAEAPVEQEAEPVRIGTQYGRSVPKKSAVRRGEIVDVDAFIGAIKSQPDFMDWLQDKANKLARARMQVAGIKIIEG